jgi:hypothetical protein
MVMTYKTVRDVAQFPVVVIAAFVFRNAAVLAVLATLLVGALLRPY